jgi:hypothetical protein
MHEIDLLEKTWNCKITFPSTEQASDVVLVSGPEFQVPNAIYGLLVRMRTVLNGKPTNLKAGHGTRIS